MRRLPGATIDFPPPNMIGWPFLSHDTTVDAGIPVAEQAIDATSDSTTLVSEGCT